MRLTTRLIWVRVRIQDVPYTGNPEPGVGEVLNARWHGSPPAQMSAFNGLPPCAASPLHDASNRVIPLTRDRNDRL